MANNPKILLLDEPFSNLDAMLRYKTKIWLKDLIKQMNLSAILVTHDKKEALSISDKIGIINDKKLIQFDNAKKMFENPNSLYVANFLCEVNELPNRYIKDIGLNIKEDKVAIIKIDECKISKDKSNCKVKILDISFCGEYYELVLNLLDYDNTDMIVKSHNSIENLNINDEAFMHIDKKDIKIIDK